MKFSARFAAAVAALFLALHAFPSYAQTAPKPELVFLDTDVGDDIDDIFALSVLLESPEVKLLGISTAFGDTELRARLLDRYLDAVGHSEIPVGAGVPTKTDNIFTQAAYARRWPERKHPDGVALLLDTIRQHPGEITLIAIGPLGDIGAAIQRDAATFSKLKQVVIMGGSVYRGYGPPGTPAAPEWNAKCDPAGLRALLGSGVPVVMMPLDSTQVAVNDQQQDRIFGAGTAVTDQLTVLYHQWKAHNGWHATGPNLFDPVAATYVVTPQFCPVTPLHIDVDDQGMTKPGDGAPNAQVCLKLDETGFLAFLQDRIAPIPASPAK